MRNRTLRRVRISQMSLLLVMKPDIEHFTFIKQGIFILCSYSIAHAMSGLILSPYLAVQEK